MVCQLAFPYISGEIFGANLNMPRVNLGLLHSLTLSSTRLAVHAIIHRGQSLFVSPLLLCMYGWKNLDHRLSGWFWHQWLMIAALTYNASSLQEPKQFNDFLHQLCKFCLENDLRSFCDFLASKGITLISKAEAIDRYQIFPPHPPLFVLLPLGLAGTRCSCIVLFTRAATSRRKRPEAFW